MIGCQRSYVQTNPNPGKPRAHVFPARKVVDQSQVLVGPDKRPHISHIRSSRCTHSRGFLSVTRPREVPEEPADAAELEPAAAAPVAEAPAADAPADAAADAAADAPAADGADGADANEAEAAEAVEAPDSQEAEDLEVDELGDDQTCEAGLGWVDWAVRDAVSG